jgi:hypothetical protein
MLFDTRAGPLQKADISIVVQFRSLLGFPQSRHLRFVGTRDSGGELRWLPRAAEAPAA